MVTGTSDSRCKRCNNIIGNQFRVIDSQNETKVDVDGNRKKKKTRKKAGLRKSKKAVKKQAHSEIECQEFRVDQAHDSFCPSDVGHKYIPVACESREDKMLRPSHVNSKNDKPRRPAQPIPPPLHLAGFGIFLFLFGQILSVWAFVDGSFIPWTIGNLISIFALVVSLWTVTSQLALMKHDREKMRRRVANLERQFEKMSDAMNSEKERPEKIEIRPKRDFKVSSFKS